MRPRFTYANVMATIALFIVIGGTAHAAVRLTTRNVANESIAGVDFKAGSMTSADLSAAAKRALVGPRGATGRQGSRGSAGATGGDGSQGARGSAAFMTSSFAFRDTGVAGQRTDTILPNNNGGVGGNWDSPTYAAADGNLPQLRTLGSYEAVNLDSSARPVISLVGMGAPGPNAIKSSDAPLKVSFTDASLLANASITLLHRRTGEDLSANSGGTLVHGRARCWFEYSPSMDPNATGTVVGTPGYVSAGAWDRDHELVNVSLSGAISGLVAGAQYNVSVKCHDADYTGSTQWQLVSANLTALGSR